MELYGSGISHPSKDEFIQHNVQSVVDEVYSIIVATEVTHLPNDAGILRTPVKMAERNMRLWQRNSQETQATMRGGGPAAATTRD